MHSSPSPSFSSQPCVYLDGFPYRNFWIWMRNSKMRFQLPCSPAMSCRLLLSVGSDDKHQRCRLLLHYWVVVICWTTGGFSTLVLITQQRIIWWLFFIIIQPVQKKCQRSTPDVPHSLTSFYSFHLTNTSRHKINFEKVKNKKAKLARTAQMLKVRKGEWH